VVVLLLLLLVAAQAPSSAMCCNISTAGSMPGTFLGRNSRCGQGVKCTPLAGSPAASRGW
jgi:hypothetical protein